MRTTSMTFDDRKAWRTDYYRRFLHGWRLRDCVACNGSGYYDHDGAPPCQGCNGTGHERYAGPKAMTVTAVATGSSRVSGTTTVTLYRSHFRRPWEGIRLAPHRTEGCSYYLLVKTASGLPMRRRAVKILHDRWLKPAGTYDISQLNPDWLRI